MNRESSVIRPQENVDHHKVYVVIAVKMQVVPMAECVVIQAIALIACKPVLKIAIA